MTVEDRRIPQIEKEFEKHRATYQKISDDIEILTWAEPGTMINKVEYLVYNNALFIKGDLGEAVFSWHPSISLNAISGFNLDYFLEKCEASEGGRHWREWDAATALIALQDYFADYDDGAETLQSIENQGGYNALNSSQEEWVQWCHEVGEEFLGADAWEWAYSIGEVVSWRMQAWLIGIKMAMEQINKTEAKLEKLRSIEVPLV